MDLLVIFVDLGRVIHRAEFGAAHGAEGGFFVVVVGEGFVVHKAGGFGVEGDILPQRVDWLTDVEKLPPKNFKK